ncbi:MAG TPA: ATP-NAD kinase, partial [Pseudomonas sp.]|nr:ATP-NAD kinase [Pseudomonas sp.]
IEFNADDLPTVTLDSGGPLSIDVNAALAYAAQERLLAIGREHPQHPLNLAL